MNETVPRPDISQDLTQVPISMPPKRELFELTDPRSSIEAQERREKVTQKFKDILDILRDIQNNNLVIRNGRRIPESEAGSDAGKCLVQYLSSRQDAPAIMQPVKRYIDKILTNPRKAGEFMSGFVGEYAFAHFLATDSNHKIEYSETEEDMVQKVDWVITKQDESETYIQAKVIALDDEQVESAQLIYDISDPKAIKDMSDNLYSYRFRRDVDIRWHINKANEMVQANQGSGKQLLYCLIPSSEISPNSGTFVNRDFTYKMRDELARVGL